MIEFPGQWSDHRELARPIVHETEKTQEELKKNGDLGSFDPQLFLDTAGVARKVADFRRGESIFSQGEAASTVMYVQTGSVSIPVEKSPLYRSKIPHP